MQELVSLKYPSSLGRNLTPYGFREKAVCLVLRGCDPFALGNRVMNDSGISRSFPLNSKLYLILARLGIHWVIKHTNAKTLLFRTTVRERSRGS